MRAQGSGPIERMEALSRNRFENRAGRVTGLRRTRVGDSSDISVESIARLPAKARLSFSGDR